MVTEIKVDGMHCQHCAMRVKKASESIENVSRADVDLEAGKATITHENADLSAVINAINALGFSASQN
ncbi:MAG: heavy-metal-associated domain-containing protein [Anaerolineaceae bacterium]|nr:heavy-metal-associated domain-containing protein [Anaerolineaceae bacterium]